MIKNDEAAFPSVVTPGSKANVGLSKREVFTLVSLFAEILVSDGKMGPDSNAAMAIQTADKTLKSLKENPCPE